VFNARKKKAAHRKGHLQRKLRRMRGLAIVRIAKDALSLILAQLFLTTSYGMKLQHVLSIEKGADPLYSTKTTGYSEK
jgi:hypothetical protein